MSHATLRELFEFSASLVERGMAEQGKDSDVVAREAPSLTGFVKETAADSLNDALDTDVIELLAQAWVKLKKVRDCADPKKHPPEETTVLPLRDVEITSTHSPILHTKVGALELPELRFTLELVAKFAAVDLVIRDGRIRSLRPGGCSALVRLKYRAVKLAERSTPEWKLPGEISLGEGVRIPFAAAAG